MSCHPEGGDDGHVWHFEVDGAALDRRTPPLRGGISATAPFHWDGSLADMTALPFDTFTTRMGGRVLQPTEVAALSTWVDAIPALRSSCALDPTTVTHGRDLFYQSGCGSCHSGPHYTNNRSMDVGTGGTFQVPSLVNVRARAPFMHDGCAPTLYARFTDKNCGGGPKHGNAGGLSNSDLSDLEMFLWSL